MALPCYGGLADGRDMLFWSESPWVAVPRTAFHGGRIRSYETESRPQRGHGIRLAPDENHFALHVGQTKYGWGLIVSCIGGDGSLIGHAFWQSSPGRFLALAGRRLSASC